MLTGCSALFRRRRLIHKLKHQHVRHRCGEQPPCSSSTNTAVDDATDGDLDFLQQLDCAQLQRLYTAVESRGRDAQDCVIVESTALQRTTPPVGKASAVAACYRRYRCCVDGGTGDDDALKHLPPPGRRVDELLDGDRFCLNPYHYFVSVPQPKLNLCETTENSDRDACCRSLPSTSTTDDTGFCTAGTSGAGCERHAGYSCDSACSAKDGSIWCQIAYWECDSRVGRLTPVSSSSVSVTTMKSTDSNVIPLDRFWSETTPPRSSTVLRCRQAIGLGLTLFRTDEHDIWLYNRSDLPLFFNCSSIVSDGPELQVRKLSTGRSVRIHREGDCRPPPVIAASSPDAGGGGDGGWSSSSLSNNAAPLPVVDVGGGGQPSAVSISFGKGWGFKYKRSLTTCCPCWVEVIFSR